MTSLFCELDIQSWYEGRTDIRLSQSDWEDAADNQFNIFKNNTTLFKNMFRQKLLSSSV